MLKSDYYYNLREVNGKKIMEIVDVDCRSRFLRAEIGKVVEEIGQRDGINVNDYLIVYQDSLFRWDAWDTANSAPVALSMTSPTAAIEKYIKILEEKATVKKIEKEIAEIDVPSYGDLIYGGLVVVTAIFLHLLSLI